MKRINNTMNKLSPRLTKQFVKSIGRVWGSAPKQVDAIRGSKGDTIVEVMLSLVVLAMVMATVYAIGTRSLSSGTESARRSEALSLAQSQVDLLINAKNNDPNFTTNYEVGQAYCIKSDGSIDTSAQSNSDKLCDSYSGGNFNVGISFSSTTNVFTITTHWSSANAPNGTGNLQLYYKMPGIYKKALVVATTASVYGTSATINGTVNPNSNPVTNCYFNYDTNPSYTNPLQASCTSNPGSGTSPVPVSANLSGLSPSTTYYFQLCATNLVGTACSTNSGTFVTPDRPTIVNESATNTVSASGNQATLNAMVNPNRTAVSACFFEWGLDTSYSAGQQNCPTPAGSGSSLVSESVNITNLSRGSTYHWQMVATNAAGTTNGGDATFVPSAFAPTAKMSSSADPGDNVAYNSTVILYWTSTNATQCTGSGFNTGNQVSGQTTVGPLTSSSYSYSVKCAGQGGQVTSNTITINVQPAPPPPPPPPAPTLSFSASPNPVSYNSSSTLSWSSSNTNSCSSSWAGGVGTSDSSSTGNLTSSTSYSISCSGAGGSTSSSLTVSVNSPPPPPPTTCNGSVSTHSGGWASASGGCSDGSANWRYSWSYSSACGYTDSGSGSGSYFSSSQRGQYSVTFYLSGNSGGSWSGSGSFVGTSRNC